MTLVELRKLLIQSQESGGLDSHIGNTPLLPIRRLVRSGDPETGRSLSARVKIYAKAEWFNPGGSVKDRPALNIIRTAIMNGDLSGDKRLLDSTSGNMGISYATLGAVWGIPVTLCVPANASPERITMLKTLGAEVILTDPAEGSDGAILVARQMAREQPQLYWYANQYNNPANWQAHYQTTGPEIFTQTEGRITHFIAGLGTSGTLIGTGRYLREQNSEIKIIAVQPDAAFHGLEGLKHMPSAIKPGIYDESVPDRILEARTEVAHEMVRRLAREEGLFVGISSGAAMAAALKVGAGLDHGLIVTVFPDAGYKYLSDRALWEAR